MASMNEALLKQNTSPDVRSPVEEKAHASQLRICQDEKEAKVTRMRVENTNNNDVDQGVAPKVKKKPSSFIDYEVVLPKNTSTYYDLLELPPDGKSLAGVDDEDVHKAFMRLRKRHES